MELRQAQVERGVTADKVPMAKGKGCKMALN